MNGYIVLSLIIFIIGYALIALEHTLRISKSAVALAMAALLWIVAALSGIAHESLKHQLEAAGGEVFGIVVFLLAAMTLIEILIHYHFFDWIQTKLASLGLTDRKQFYLMALLTFFLSALFDNLTVTIIMIQIARGFFKRTNLLIIAAGIVIFANAGGAWSPIGDVTTIMIWLAGKVSALQLISVAFLPSAALAVVAALLLGRQIVTDTADTVQKGDHRYTRGEVVVIVLCIVSFLLPLIMNTLGLAPYMGLLFGLGVTWLCIGIFQTHLSTNTHLEANIDALLKKTDISSIKFFIGVLLAVSALQAMGVLDAVSVFLYGTDQQTHRIIASNMVLGLFSAVVDNVPLTAVALDMIRVIDHRIWGLLAVAVGTGGSLLSIGSVSGVVAVGMIRELTFSRYLKIAFVPALLGYLVAMGVWYLQYLSGWAF